MSSYDEEGIYMVRMVIEGRCPMERMEAFFNWVKGPGFAELASESGMKNWVVSRPLAGLMADALGCVYSIECEVENLAGVATITRSEAYMTFGKALFELTGNSSITRNFYAIDARA